VRGLASIADSLLLHRSCIGDCKAVSLRHQNTLIPFIPRPPCSPPPRSRLPSLVLLSSIYRFTLSAISRVTLFPNPCLSLPTYPPACETKVLYQVRISATSRPPPSHSAKHPRTNNHNTKQKQYERYTMGTNVQTAITLLNHYYQPQSHLHALDTP
jgi:hypothetical protein